MTLTTYDLKCIRDAVKVGIREERAERKAQEDSWPPECKGYRPLVSLGGVCVCGLLRSAHEGGGRDDISV